MDASEVVYKLQDNPFNNGKSWCCDETAGWMMPRNGQKLGSSIGFAIYLRESINHYAAKVHPLTILISKIVNFRLMPLQTLNKKLLLIEAQSKHCLSKRKHMSYTNMQAVWWDSLRFFIKQKWNGKKCGIRNVHLGSESFNHNQMNKQNSGTKRIWNVQLYREAEVNGHIDEWPKEFNPTHLRRYWAHRWGLRLASKIYRGFFSKTVFLS